MRTEVINVIRENLIEIIPDLEGQEISGEESLVALGANSLDRGELITLTLERLGLDLPRIHFAGAQTINEIADLIIQKKQPA
jgi:polyketide biosynthesis acyl carrier protein